MQSSPHLAIFALLTALACDAGRWPDTTNPPNAPDPVDRNAAAEDLYFELARLHSLGLVTSERMEALQASLDRLEVDPNVADRARVTREAIASMLRRTLGELRRTDPELVDGMEGREYARRLHRQGVVVSQDLSEVTLVIAGLLGTPTSKGELALVALMPAGGYLVGKIANVAFKRAVFLLRRTRTVDELVMASERLGVQFRVARGSQELASTISGRPMDEKLFARIKAAFERQGGIFLQSADVDRYLKMHGAEAITDNAKQILFPSRPTTSAVFEELIHTAQFRTGKFNALVDQVGVAEAKRTLEIEAAEKLIRNAKAWSIPEEETRETAARLARLKAGGGG
jgi:hypothetical protein